MTESSFGEKAQDERPGCKSILRRLVVGLAVFASTALAAATLLAWAARWHWTLDLLTHFPVPYAIGGLVLLAVLIGLRKWKLAVLPLLVATFNAAQFLPIYLPVQEETDGSAMYRAVSANVYTGNRDRDHFINFIRVEQPDLILVMEVDNDWVRRLGRLESQYPYSVIRARADNFGIGLYSRAPIRCSEVVEMTSAELPTIVATLDVGGREATVIGTHPLPPVGGRNSELRNQQLREVGDLAAQLPGPTILLGDLNVTPWSPHFSDLLDRSNLRDGRQGFGVQPSWPALPWLLRIPIDHTLVSEDVRVVGRRLGPNIGSDHRPVVLEFQMAE